MTRFEFTGDMGNPDDNDSGEWVLLENGSVQLIPSPELRAHIEQLSQQVGDTALKWGTTLLVSLAGAGAYLYLKGKRPAGWTLFGLSGTTGLLAGAVRLGAIRFDESMFSPHPVKTVTVRHLENGGLAIRIRNKKTLPPWTMTLSSGQFDRGEAERFVQAVEILKGADY